MKIIEVALEHAIWPLVVIIIFLFLRAPISRLLRNMKFFRTGNFELQFSEQIYRQGFSTSQLAEIRNLTEGDLDLFLLISYSDAPEFKYVIPVDSTELHKESIIRLQEAGLIRIVTLTASGDPATHVTTPTGRRIRSLLVRSTTDLLREDT